MLAAGRRDASADLIGASGEELLAAEVWLALDGLGKVTGAIAIDDVLERIFSRFCIGKQVYGRAVSQIGFA